MRLNTTLKKFGFKWVQPLPKCPWPLCSNWHRCFYRIHFASMSYNGGAATTTATFGLGWPSGNGNNSECLFAETLKRIPKKYQPGKALHEAFPLHSNHNRCPPLPMCVCSWGSFCRSFLARWNRKRKWFQQWLYRIVSGLLPCMYDH